MGPELSWGGRARTFNLLVNSQALCQLSYTPSTARPEEPLRLFSFPFLPESSLGAVALQHRRESEGSENAGSV